MLDSVEYVSLLQYSPRGISDVCKTSRRVKDSIKAGRIDNFRKRISEIVANKVELLTPFLNKTVTLIPAPRSSPTRESDLWPALEIARLLESLKLGEVSTCLIRSTAIKKSSLYFTGDERPSIEDQFNTLSVKDFIPASNITLVDDVITLGRTSIAMASRLAEKFPNSTVRIFALIQTQGLEPDIHDILNVQTGTIILNRGSGKCRR